MKTILIAGGGTGGHVFPGLAVARALRDVADVTIVFVGSPRGLENRIVPTHGYVLELLRVEPMKGGGPARAARGAFVASTAMRQAARLIRRLRPSAILSVGGYAAGPVALAGAIARVPLAILEPNSTLGLANRLVAPFASRAYVAWSDTARHFRGDKVRMFGVPLRAGFEPDAYTVTPGVRRLLVLGGSQGARALNDRVPPAIARVAAALGEVHVVHQTGHERAASVASAYAKAGLRSVTVVPFIDDVAAQIARADLVVARAGAVTVAEITAIGRASVLVPFPHAAADHQAKNALSLASLGAAVCVRQEAADEVRLATELSWLFGNDARRVGMARTAREHGHPSAALHVALDLLALAGIVQRPASRPVSKAAS